MEIPLNLSHQQSAATEEELLTDLYDEEVYTSKEDDLRIAGAVFIGL